MLQSGGKRPSLVIVSPTHEGGEPMSKETREVVKNLYNDLSPRDRHHLVKHLGLLNDLTFQCVKDEVINQRFFNWLQKSNLKYES